MFEPEGDGSHRVIDGLHVNGSDLARGLASGVSEGVSITGGLAGDGANFAETWVIAGDAAGPQRVAAIGLYGEGLRIGYGSMGGWEPFGPLRTITRAEGNVLYELDGRSALDLYKLYLGPLAAQLPGSALLFPILVTEPKGGEGVVRTVLSVDEQTKSMTFAGDIPDGGRVQFMKTNVDDLVDGARAAAKFSLSGLGDARPDLALLVSCVGRKLVMKQRIEEEVEAVREVFGPNTKIAGFYSYGELCPFKQGGERRLHNQTMTITAFAEHLILTGQCMHGLLRRQLGKYLGVKGEAPPTLRPFLAAVDAAYTDFDSGLAMMERSLELSCKELSDARDAATTAQRRLTDALESISEGFFLFDADDRMVLCNSRFREFYPGMADVFRPGLGFEEMLRAAAERRIVADAAARPQEWIEGRLVQHRNPTGPFLQPQRDGRWIQISERKTQDGGTAGVFTDVTELKHREEELAAARDEAMAATQAKSKFLASMSHELRTPLNAIIGFTRLVMRRAKDTLPAKQYENLEKVLVSAEHLLSPINTVLDLAKIESGRTEVNPSEFPLEPLLDLCLTTVEPMIKADRVRLMKDVQGPLPVVYTDQGKLKQILINLLSNAAKFTETGSITLRGRGLGERVEVAVADTGSGIPKAALELVFEEFRQVDGGSERVHKGTGLGLTISRRLARLLGGDITVESDLGKGSTFTITLPVRLVGLPERKPMARAQATPEAPVRPAETRPRRVSRSLRSRLMP